MASRFLPACWQAFASLLAGRCLRTGKVLPVCWQCFANRLSLSWQNKSKRPSLVPCVALYVGIKSRFYVCFRLSDDVQHGSLLVRRKQPLAFAYAVVGSLSEVRYQAADDGSALVVGQVVQQVHETFGVAHLLAGAEERTVSLQGGKPFGADDVPVIFISRHALRGQLAEAVGSFGAFMVEAQGVVEGDLGVIYIFFHDEAVL